MIQNLKINLYLYLIFKEKFSGLIPYKPQKYQQSIAI